MERIAWPEGKRFAFTIFDDTDRGTVDNLGPVYDLLDDLGFKTTKSVWPVTGKRNPAIPGSTSDDPHYRDWTLRLMSRGFEIGFHNATFHSSTRDETIHALDRFRAIYGHDPYTAANHAENTEAIYWGAHRLSGLRHRAYHLFERFRSGGGFSGHVEGDEHFWGDVCRARIKYVRNFVYREIDTLGACPIMPYHDPERPYVNYWFASTEGGNVWSFVDALAERHQDALEEAGGACIMYTHFGKGFCRDGALDTRFRELMERLARKNGWFVPVHDLLDYLQAKNGSSYIDASSRGELEKRWVNQQLRHLARRAGQAARKPVHRAP